MTELDRLILFGPIEHAELVLRERGLDADEVRRRGAAFVDDLMRDLAQAGAARRALFHQQWEPPMGPIAWATEHWGEDTARRLFPMPDVISEKD